MPILRGASRSLAAAGLAGSVVVLVPTADIASATPSLPAPGTNLIVNGNFYKPGPANHEGATPTHWKLVDLGAETHPYDAAIGAYNAKGKYPPPPGNPDPKDVADEVFYEAGTATGIEGIGGQQASSTFGSITQANNPQVSFSDVQKDAPEASVADWAGGGLEINLTAGTKSYTLVYYNQWTAYKGTFSSKPKDTSTTKYITGPTVTAGAWYTWKARSLNSDVRAQFGFKSYKVSNVTFIDLEDTTSSASPYPNMDGYIADVAIAEGS
jgi:hypothetical protein